MHSPDALPAPLAAGPTPGSPADAAAPRVGYVVKRYPRYSETFIVTEILAHEAAGLDIEIFALHPSTDTHYQDAVSRVRAPVRYLTAQSLKATDLWEQMLEIARETPAFWSLLEHARGEEAREVYQAILLAQAVRRHGITHLHAHFATTAASVARLASIFTGVPYTLTAHAKDIFHKDVVPDDLRRKLEGAAGVVTVSDYNLRYLRERFGPAATARARRIYNGLPLEHLKYESPLGRAPLVVAVGRLVEKKGFAVLLDACAILRDRGVRFRCQLVGEGEAEPALRAQHAALRLGGVVDLAGPRPQNEIFRLVQQAAALAAPCIVGGDGNQDGLPTVLLEAMALGTPCVSTDVTGIPEVIRHNETGLMVPQRDPLALADALEQLLGDEVLRARLARAARQHVDAHFDTRHNTAVMRELFASPTGSVAAPDRAAAGEPEVRDEPEEGRGEMALAREGA